MYLTQYAKYHFRRDEIQPMLSDFQPTQGETEHWKVQRNSKDTENWTFQIV